MSTKYVVKMVLLLVCSLSFALFGQEAEPNNTIENANPLTLNVLLDAKLSVADTVDFFSVNVQSTNMYFIGTVTNFVFNAEKVLNMDVVGADGKSVLNSSPTGRYKNFGARLTGWVPPATGKYYVKVWSTSAKLAAVADASYQMRFWYGTPKETLMAREPDNTPAQANLLGDIPTDGTRIYSYLYNEYAEGDTFKTNWNDIDFYKFTVPEAGMQIVAETFTPAIQWNHPSWVRDTDTKIYLFDSAGNLLPIANDDKDPWTGDTWDDKTGWFSNSCSRFVSPEVPAAGTYYLGVASVYNTITGLEKRKPHESDMNPGGGEYYVSVNIIGANDPSLVAQSLPLNELKNGSISVADTMDVWGIYAEADKMYTIATVTDMDKFNAKNILKMSVVDENNASVLNSDPSSRNDAYGAILRGWVPPKTGVYYVKVWGAPAKLATVADPSYQMRFWHGTPLSVAGTVHEPDNVVADAVNLPAAPVDGTMIHGYLYNDYVEADTFRTNWNDADLYKIEVPEAGMILVAETFTATRLEGHPEWIREVDSEIELLDATGAVTPINNDDKDAWAGDVDYGILSNTFSRMVTPEIPAAGTYYVRVISYYNSVNRNEKPHQSHRNAGGGEYLVSFRLISANNPSLVAQSLPLNVLKNGSISVADTMDVWGINAEANKMYTIATVTDMDKFNAKNILKMSVVDENNVSVLNSDPSSRNDAYGAILRGWVPPKTGVYYVKVWGAPAKLATVADPSYQMRFWHGTPLSVAGTVHEPDNVVADAVKLPAAPVDGTMIHGYLYNDYVEADTFRTNWNDADLYKIEVPQAGMILVAETFTATRLEGHPEWIREVDSEIELLDATGAVTPINNDDKDAWAGDVDYGILSNTFSRMVTPEIPAAGTYYVRVISYYNSVNRNEKPHQSHRNAGGGEYLVSFRLISANDPSLVAQSLPLNVLKNGSISVADTMDVWGIYAEANKMYTIATVTDMDKFNAKNIIKMSVVDENNASVLNSDPSSRNDAYGAILRGWVPPKTGVYYVKVWGAPAKLATVADPSYQMRFWHGTPLSVAGTVHEPDNVVADAVKLPAAPVDGTMIHGYLYNDYVEADTFRTNWNDADLYKIEVPQAGMILTAETFTATRLEGHPEWIREVDSEIELLDATGAVTPINSDDKDAWAGDVDYGILSNTFSRFVTPEIPAAGTYYVRVISYYNSVNRNEKPHQSHRNAGGGEYLVSFTLTWPQEHEANNDMASANLLTLQTITDATLAPTDSVDYFKFLAEADKMYTLNTIAPRGVNAKSVIKMDVLDETGKSVLNSDPSSRYDSWGARLTGWVPPKAGIYYIKIKANVATFTADYPYKIRLWFGTALSLANATHEPDDTAADAAKLPALDLSKPEKIHGYLYKDFVDSLGVHYNWNDFDLYKVVLKAGQVLTAELFTAGPDSCIRDLDTELVLCDSTGAETPINNDDKDAWEGDPWENYYPTVFSNTYSRFVTPEIPVSGTYYLQVNSYYNSRNRTEKFGSSDKNPGGGEYLLQATVTGGTGVAEKIDNMPNRFALSQNYPNPFNPTTTIKYSLPQAENVKLTIFNMLGEKVRELVNVQQQTGSYTVSWDGKDSNGVRMSTGIYFYKIEAGSFVKVNKMIMLK